MSKEYQQGQKAAANGKTNVPPKNVSPAQQPQFDQGHKAQQAKQGKKS